MDDYIKIIDKKYSKKTLQLLVGQKQPDFSNIQDNILLLSEVVDDPYKLPYLIEQIQSLEIEDKDKFRFALLRVQIDSELHMNEDIQRNQQRRYVAQIIEKLLYGEILLEVGGKEEEIEEADIWEGKNQQPKD